ncbi:MAG: hypothetical protein ACREP6_06705 [Candidatus Binataceae bacterium]
MTQPRLGIAGVGIAALQVLPSLREIADHVHRLAEVILSHQVPAPLGRPPAGR